jgi:cytochrome P450
VVQDFSMRLPLDVISELIGIPETQREEVHLLSDRLAEAQGRADDEDVSRSLEELRSLLLALVPERRSDAGTRGMMSSAC